MAESSHARRSVMASFLEVCNKAKAQLHTFRTVKVVMGNECCDLDSAVSALVYALLCHEEAKLLKKNDTAVFPLLNINRSDLHIKSEVVFWMKKHHVRVDHLLTRDDLDLKSLSEYSRLEVILVDHHVPCTTDAFLKKFIVEIYDHRPPEEGWEWNGKKTLLRAGSCASLVALEVMKRHPVLLEEDICLLLYGCILFDTACLSTRAGWTSQTDVSATSELQKYLGYCVKEQEIFKELHAIRSDVSFLTPSQMLVKDMKVINGVPICSLPILVQKFVQLPPARRVLKEFCDQRNITAMMMMGLHIDQDDVIRDLAVFSASERRVGQQIIEHLTRSSSPSLLLEPLRSVIPDLTLFNVGNVEMSRKEIVPMVKTATRMP